MMTRIDALEAQIKAHQVGETWTETLYTVHMSTPTTSGDFYRGLESAEKAREMAARERARDPRNYHNWRACRVTLEWERLSDLGIPAIATEIAREYLD